MRCTACGESWFVPPPEPIEDLGPADRIDSPRERPDHKQRGAWLKVGVAENERNNRNAAGDAAKNKAILADDFEDDDDALFESPMAVAAQKAKTAKPAFGAAKTAKARADDETPPKGWRKGRQFFVEDDDGREEQERRPFFAWGRKKNDEDNEDRRASASGSERENALRFADDDGNDARRSEEDHDAGFDDENDAPGGASVVDADWEDVDRHGGRQRGFGRRVRADRRRATALARVEDARDFDPEMFDEEFFASLRVTPRELERAVRKARRRAEAREKNRLTPLKAFGWSAWVAAVAGAIYALVVYRDEIVKIAPSAADAYAVVGIETNPYGLKIDDVRHRLAMSTSGPTIEITGALKNAAAAPADAPLLQAEALGPRGELLSRWTFSPGEDQIPGGGAAEFMTRAPAPDGVVEVALSFAPEQSAVGDLLQRDE